MFVSLHVEQRLSAERAEIDERKTKTENDAAAPGNFWLPPGSVLHQPGWVSRAEVCRRRKSTQLLPPPAPFCANKIYPLNGRIWISSGSRFRSHKSDVTVRLPLITQRFWARWGLLRSHTYVTKDYFEPLTVPSVSPPDIITLFINLFAYLSFAVVQWWGGGHTFECWNKE